MKNPFTPILARQRAVLFDGGLATELERRGANLSSHLWSAKLIADEPDNAEAQRYLAACRATLENIYLVHLGTDGAVPRLAVTPEQLRQLNPDRWAAFILSHVDGQSTIEEITDIAGMPRLDALRVLYELLQQGLIGITPSR